MRVTQSMLTANTMRNISQGYNRLSVLQDQMNGKKITKPSQDPVVAMKGMRYRAEVAEVNQFKKNLDEVYSWMDTTESALDDGTEALKRIRELATDAASDSKTQTERSNIAKEISQLKEHIQSLANTKNNDKYVFNGTNTTTSPVVDLTGMNLGNDGFYKDGVLKVDDELKGLDVMHGGKTFRYVGDDVEGNLIFQDRNQLGNPEFPANPADLPAFNDKATQLKVKTDTDGFEATFSAPNKEGVVTSKDARQNDVIISKQSAVSLNSQSVEVEILKGVTIPVNINPNKVFSNQLFADITRLENALNDQTIDGTELTGYIDEFYNHIDHFVSERSELGARINRVEMMENRIDNQKIIANRVMSNNEDSDIEEVYINLTIQQSVHRAALYAGGQIIQPTLMDFLR